MKKVAFSVCLTAILCLVSVPAFAQDCAKIKDGTIVDGAGQPVVLGYDKYGYNYQAHMFNGLYENFSRPAVVVTEGTENMVMKWSDDWLANVDCNGDTKLDRGLDPKTGQSTGVSRGWVTNHFEGDYLGSDGEMHHYTYFAKIVWVGPVPSGTDPWAAVRIWGSYAVIEELQNDLFGEYGGNYRSKIKSPGLGLF